jgi:small subunit ribosomal protein S4e
MLSKMDGIWAPRPSPGPHKLRECLPVILILRNRLKYALTGKETKQICMEKHVYVDGKVRTDPSYPVGFMDIVELPKANDSFRVIFDPKGRFTLHRVDNTEKTYKLCRVRSVATTLKKVPYIVTHDGRTIRYPDPVIKKNDTIKLDLASGKILDVMKFEAGKVCMITKGRNAGRVGSIVHMERHPGAFDIVTVRDATGNSFATRLENVFVIGNSLESLAITLPKGQGIKLSIIEERDMIMKQNKAI